MRISLAPDPTMRVLVQNILHTLIDRHGNLTKLKKPTIDYAGVNLQMEKCSRPDMIFIRKYGPEIFTSLYENLELPNNTPENMEHLYTTIALIAVELLHEETIMDLTRLLLSIQVRHAILSLFTTFQGHSL